MSLYRTAVYLSLFGITQLVATIQRAAASPKDSPAEASVRVLVAYDSLYGNTEKMAGGVAQGAGRVPGAQVTVKKVEDVTAQDLQHADAIILGSPTYYANIPGRMKAIMDTWSWKMKVDFTDKVGGAFSTGGGQAGGKEHVLVSLLLFMVNVRMVVAGPLYQDAEGDDKWAELGAAAATGPTDPGIDEKDLDGALRVGERVAQLAKKMKRGEREMARRGDKEGGRQEEGE
jgi:NAD(P)H dehydrogenase (quinone)